jgi:hypothetical protein
MQRISASKPSNPRHRPKEHQSSGPTRCRSGRCADTLHGRPPSITAESWFRNETVEDSPLGVGEVSTVITIHCSVPETRPLYSKPFIYSGRLAGRSDAPDRGATVAGRRWHRIPAALIETLTIRAASGGSGT